MQNLYGVFNRSESADSENNETILKNSVMNK